MGCSWFVPACKSELCSDLTLVAWNQLWCEYLEKVANATNQSSVLFWFFFRELVVKYLPAHHSSQVLTVSTHKKSEVYFPEKANDGGFRLRHSSHLRGQVKGTMLKTSIICENLYNAHRECLQVAFPLSRDWGSFSGETKLPKRKDLCIMIFCGWVGPSTKDLANSSDHPAVN